MNELTEIINTLTRETGINFNQAVSILESFFTGSAETEKLFNIYIEHEDYKAIQKQAHQIKGTAANLRMPQVREYAELIETGAKECNIDLCEQYILIMSEHIKAFKSQMSLYLEIQKLRILIVEDNLASGKMLEQIIINLGHYSLGVVSSPEQALVSVKNELPDVIFMDIDLSTEMNGIYTAELLSGYYSIPVIFASVHADEATIKKANTYGIGYVVKPFTSTEIEDMIGLASKSIVNSRDVNKAEQKKLKVKDDNRMFFINLYDVIYFEARLHIILVYTEYKIFELRTSLKDIKTLDANGHFIQPHRSFLVNRSYVSELINEDYNYYLKLKSFPDLIPVSKNNAKIIKNVF